MFSQLLSVHKSALIVLLGALFLFFQSSFLYSELDIRFSVLKEQQQRFPSSAAAQRMNAWQLALQQLEGQSEEQQIKGINRFFYRQIRYQTDDQLYGKNDYWASPLELLGHGLGDCEDDEITIELALSSQFDTGHYRTIRLLVADDSEAFVKQASAYSALITKWKFEY